MLRKRLMAVVLSAVMTAAIFTGCASKDDSSKSDNKSAKTEQQKSDAKEEKSKDSKSEAAKAPIEDGTYTAEFKTDSTMFHVNEANEGKGTLTVEDGKMTIHISLVSKNIVNLFPGTAKEAQKKGAKFLKPTTDKVTYSDGTTEEVYGLIYGILALGIYITYKILDFPDLTVDGSFPLGAAITAALLTRGMNPYITLILSFLAGAVAGICTGLIHVKCKVRDLLSGIIMMTALWTINLYIAGTANVPLFSQKTIFKNDLMDKIIPDALVPYSTLIIILVLAVICKVLLDLYLNTKSGFLLRAVGDNDVLVVSLAKDKGNIKILGLAISNGLVALAGCVFAQEERVFEISMGTGAMVIGLASVIIGTSIFRKLTLLRTTTAVLIGSIIYKACVAIALRNFDPQAMKLVTAVLFLIVLIISMERKKKVNTNA